jgi:uncharacterized protein YjiS (DUF1127 family)
MQQSTHQATALDGDSTRSRLLRTLCRARGPVDRLADTLALWHFRARSRRELAQLEDRILKDAGIDRSEANKPFWRA